MKNRQLFTNIFFISFLVLSFSCKDTPPGPQPEPPLDTTFVTKEQHAIPWPGLADSPWPMFLHDPQHTGRSPYLGPQEGKMEWMFDAGHNMSLLPNKVFQLLSIENETETKYFLMNQSFGNTLNIYSSPAIDVDGTVYFGCENRYFYAVNPNGTLKWKVLGGGSDSSPLIAADGTIYCYGGGEPQINFYLYAYNRDGNLKWQYIIEDFEPLSAPVISKDGGIIYLAAGSLYAIRNDGTLHWKIKPDSLNSFHYSSAISPDGTTLFVPSKRALYAFDTSGTLKWSFGRTPSTPVVDNDGNVYFSGSNAVGGAGDALYCFTQLGVMRWQIKNIFTGGEDAGPAIGYDGSIYITGIALYASDYAGKLRWQYYFPYQHYSQCIPAIDNIGTIYVGSLTTRLPDDTLNFFAINPNGTTKYSISLRSPDGTVPDIDSRPAISADGKIYVGSDRPRGFHLYKIK